jgi:CO/xanthine dehydrogenase FAD-binding subunit
VAVGPGGAREIPAAGLASGWFTTTLKPDEILTEILLPVGAGVATVAAFREWSPRAHDFATAGVGVSLDLDADGTCVAVAAAACGAGATPLVLSEVLGAAGLLGWVCRPGAEPAASLLRAVAAATTGACGDGDPDRAELAGLLAARAVRAACRRRVAPAVAA